MAREVRWTTLPRPQLDVTSMKRWSSEACSCLADHSIPETLETWSGSRRKLCSQPWWHFKNRGHCLACPVLWWPSSIVWMTHHRISSTVFWRPAGMSFSFFPWYTVTASQSKQSVQRCLCKHESHVKLKESVFSQGQRSSWGVSSSHMGCGLMSVTWFPAKMPEQCWDWSHEQPPRPT